MEFHKNFGKSVIFAIVLSILEVVGQTYIRKYYLDHPASYLYPLMTCIAYATEIVVLYFSYAYANLTVMNTLWNAVTIVLVPIIGVSVFHEKISKVGWFGILLTIIGGTLIGIER